MGLAYTVAVVSLFDEYANDMLYLAEGSCFPRYILWFDFGEAVVIDFDWLDHVDSQASLPSGNEAFEPDGEEKVTRYPRRERRVPELFQASYARIKNAKASDSTIHTSAGAPHLQLCI